LAKLNEKVFSFVTINQRKARRNEQEKKRREIKALNKQKEMNEA
tara:strand:- start:104 stop:235 length:132 start_codon:yes stop_codon:yes gene_type:complete